MAGTENLPLTAVESVQERRDSMSVSPELKAALTPGRLITLDAKQNAGAEAISRVLGGKQKIDIQFSAEDKNKLSGTLNQQLAEKLYGKDYVALSPDQKYFVVSIEAALTAQHVNPSMTAVGDHFIFDFSNGTYFVDRGGDNIVDDQGRIQVPERQEVTGVAREKLEAELLALEKDGLLVKALQQFKEDPTFNGRLRFLAEEAGFVDLVNFYIKNESQKLAHDTNNLGYVGSPEQNVAYLKAYLALQRHRQLGTALPTEISTPEPAPNPKPVSQTPPEEVDTGVPDDFFKEPTPPNFEDAGDEFKFNTETPQDTSRTVPRAPEQAETVPFSTLYQIIDGVTKEEAYKGAGATIDVAGPGLDGAVAVTVKVGQRSEVIQLTPPKDPHGTWSVGLPEREGEEAKARPESELAAVTRQVLDGLILQETQENPLDAQWTTILDAYTAAAQQYGLTLTAENGVPTHKIPSLLDGSVNQKYSHTLVLTNEQGEQVRIYVAMPLMGRKSYFDSNVRVVTETQKVVARSSSSSNGTTVERSVSLPETELNHGESLNNAFYSALEDFITSPTEPDLLAARLKVYELDLQLLNSRPVAEQLSALEVWMNDVQATFKQAQKEPIPQEAYDRLLLNLQEVSRWLSEFEKKEDLNPTWKALVERLHEEMSEIGQTGVKIKETEKAAEPPEASETPKPGSYEDLEAQINAHSMAPADWALVETAYLEMVKKHPLKTSASDHYSGSKAAEARGDWVTALDRMKKAEGKKNDDSLSEYMQGLIQSNIEGYKRKLTESTPAPVAEALPEGWTKEMLTAKKRGDELGISSAAPMDQATLSSQIPALREVAKNYPTEFAKRFITADGRPFVQVSFHSPNLDTTGNLIRGTVELTTVGGDIIPVPVEAQKVTDKEIKAYMAAQEAIGQPLDIVTVRTRLAYDRYNAAMKAALEAQVPDIQAKLTAYNESNKD